MGGKGSGGGIQDYYGSIAGIVSLGQLDFIWGVMVNNALVWPNKIKIWDAKNFHAGAQVIWTDGNVYRASGLTNLDPPTFPWVLRAVPWTAGTWAANSRVLYLGNVFLTTGSNSATPPSPAELPTKPFVGQGEAFYLPVTIRGWKFESTPTVWSSAGRWAANSIVAWKGVVYSTPTATNIEPPTAPWVRWKVDRGSSPNPLKMTVTDMGDMYLYWGTTDQTLDVTNEQFLASQGHPPYRHRAVLVLKKFLFGTETVSPPDVTILGGRKPVQSLIVGSATDMDADWQVNPWCVLAELLTNPIWGLGLPASWFNAASWQAEADHCAANPELYYISPIFTNAKKVRELVADMLSYPDAFIFWNTLAQLQAGHWPHGEAPPAFDATNTVNQDNWVREPRWDSEGWGGTANATQVTFQDIQAAFNNRPVQVPNLFNRTITKRLLSQAADRPYIVRVNQALAWAGELSKIGGEQSLRGTSDIRAETASAVRPGSLFLLTDDQTGMSQVQRCTKRELSAPPTGVVTLTHETERGVSARAYAPTPGAGPASPAAAPSPITSFQFVQLPYELSSGPNQLGLVASRRDTKTNGLQVWYKQADGSALQLLGTLKAFAISGTVDSAYNVTQNFGAVTQGNTYNLNDENIYDLVTVTFGAGPTTATAGTDYVVDLVEGTITVVTGGAITTGSALHVTYTLGVSVFMTDSTPADDIEAVSGSLTEDEILDNTILVFGFQQSNPQLFEIMSLKEITAGTGGRYNLNLFGARYGSEKGGDGSYDWAQFDYMFVVFRSDLVALQHTSFAGLQSVNGVAYFALAPATKWFQADPLDIYDEASNPAGFSTDCSYTFDNLYAPTATWDGLFKNGATIGSFSAAFLTTDVFDFTFTISDANADFRRATLTAATGPEEITLWAQEFEPSSGETRTVEFQLPVGSWKLSLNVSDAAGNFASIPLTFSGSEVVMTIGNQAPAPILYSYTNTSSPGTTNGYITSLKFGLLRDDLDEVQWAVLPAGSFPSGGTTWTNATLGTPHSGGTGAYGPIPNFRANKWLWARSVKTGLTNSANVLFKWSDVK